MDRKGQENRFSPSGTPASQTCSIFTMVQRLAYERDFYELVLFLEDHRSRNM
jgi:hypothetical protein